MYIGQLFCTCKNLKVVNNILFTSSLPCHPEGSVEFLEFVELPLGHTPKEVWNSWNSWKSDGPLPYTPKEVWNSWNSWKSQCHTPWRKCEIPGIRRGPSAIHLEGSVEFLEFMEVVLPYTNTCISLVHRSKFYSEHCLTKTGFIKTFPCRMSRPITFHSTRPHVYKGFLLFPHFYTANTPISVVLVGPSCFSRHSRVRPLKNIQPEERSAWAPWL